MLRKNSVLFKPDETNRDKVFSVCNTWLSVVVYVDDMKGAGE